MPIYEYRCAKCARQFDVLVRTGTVIACTQCGSEELEKLLSVPGIKSETTHGLAMAAARRRDKAQGMEREAAQREYERNHD